MFLLSLEPRNFKDILNKKFGRKRIAKMIIASSILLLLLNNLLFNKRVLNQNELIVYDVSKASVIDIFHGNQLFTIKSEGIDHKKIDFAAKSYRIFNGNPTKLEINQRKTVNIENFDFDGIGLLSFKDKLIFLVRGYNENDKIPCYSDVLLVTHNSGFPSANLLKYHSTKMVVLDNSIDYKTKKKWKNACVENNISMHDIYYDGVFKLN
jgi:hypothetical protein